MKTYNHIFTDLNNLREFAQINMLDDGGKYLVRVCTSVHTIEMIPGLIKDIKEVFPGSQIAGTSVTSVIHNGQITENACLISVTKFESSDFTVRVFDLTDKDISYAAQNTLELFSAGRTKAAIVHFTSLFADVRSYLGIIKENYPDVAMTGGISGITPQQRFIPFVFDENGVCVSGMIITVLDGWKLKVYGSVMQGHEAVGDVYTITKVKDNEIAEIDGIRSAVWIREFFGKTDAVPGSTELQQIMDDILLRFPLVFEESNGSNAFLRYNPENDSIQIAQHVSEGTKFRLGYISSSASILACKKACSELESASIESLFAYSCMLKKQLLSNCASWEFSPFVNTDISGGFLCGEIAYVEGQNNFYNGTCSVLGISEKPAFINIDKEAFKKMDNLKDDNREILNYVLKMQSESIIKKNKQLSQQIIEQEHKAIKKLFLDEQSGLYDIAKFAFDNEGKRFNKACMIAVEKGSVLRSYYGNDDFRMVVIKDLQLITGFFGMEDFNYYMYNKHTMVIVADESYDSEKFQKLVKKFYLECGQFTVESLGITCLNSVSAVIDEYDKLVEKAATTLLKGEKTGLRYGVYKPSSGGAMQIAEQMKWVEIISDAIANNRVVPYFQPIYDNRASKVNKFESLVRIVGKDGKVYPPGMFLDIAKEFRLYQQVSEQMISKVFNLFEDRDETVSINISAYDINSAEMKEKIYDRLKGLKNPQNFIFEIVESEELQDFDVVFDFVKTVGSYGIKIAIDDFGSGYSNLVEIAKLEPDFIKIDGEIIRKINVSSIHRTIAETTVHMADKFGIELIAEYVENLELQDTILDLKVEYSQGYLFSKPMPFDEIDGYLKSFPVSGE